MSKHENVVKTPKGDSRKNALIQNEKEVQTGWEETKIHLTKISNQPKFYLTFPYPYMNGRLHLGHAYTLSKVDFMARYKRNQGHNVFFPFAFHGTGMPIPAAAAHVVDDLKEWKIGDPLSSGSQLEKLSKMGIPPEEFEKFQDPNYWIKYFPEVAKKDLTKFGLSADFERSFMTTKLNPYYDAFIQWQFRILERKGYLKFGKKHVIWSEKDNQVCSDHDRRIGEEAKPQEYTLIKAKLVESSDPEVMALMEKYSPSLLCATLRPETMYGQTNLWIHRNISYALFKIKEDYYIARLETYRNLRHQLDDVTLVQEDVLKGSNLEGSSVKVPFRSDPVQVFHMNNVSDKRGTAIVTSVPTDSPTDYLNWRYYDQSRDKYPNLKLDSVLSPIIQVGESTQYAVDSIEKSKIKLGQKEKLENIHKKVYKDEHDLGVMMVGKYKGLKANQASLKVKEDLIQSGEALPYCEPSELVVSRSNDKCVVSLTDQWFINYSDPILTEKVNDYIKNELTVYPEEAKELYLNVSNWIKEWAVSRTNGLGTQLPIDPQYLIESLSDSTIYMAYYTISDKIKQLPIELVNDELFNYLFLDQPSPKVVDELGDSDKTLVSKMKVEFQHWYPLDLRISGKDLIGNHLVMALYNHVMVWDDVKMMPQGYSTNGHIQLNGEKMSKSGTFMTLRDAIDKHGVDATRIALALGADSNDNGNFDENNAMDSVMMLTIESEWFKELYQLKQETSPGTSVRNNTWDNYFRESLKKITLDYQNNMENMQYRKALMNIYKLRNTRDVYRNHQNLALNYLGNCLDFVEIFLMFLSPFAPHWTQTEIAILETEQEFLFEFPYQKADAVVDQETLYLVDTLMESISKTRKSYAVLNRGKKKKGIPTSLHLKTCSEISPEVSSLIQKFLEKMTNSNGQTEKEVSVELIKEADKKDKKFIGPVLSEIAKNVGQYTSEWCRFARSEDLNQRYSEILEKWSKILLADLQLPEIKTEFIESTGEPYKMFPCLTVPKFEF